MGPLLLVPAACATCPAAALPTAEPGLFVPRVFDYPAERCIRDGDVELHVNVPSATFKLGAPAPYANPSQADPVFCQYLLYASSATGMVGQTNGQALTTIHMLGRHLRVQPQAGPAMARRLQFNPVHSGKPMKPTAQQPSGLMYWCPQLSNGLVRLAMCNPEDVEPACIMGYPPTADGPARPGYVCVPTSIFTPDLLYPAVQAGALLSEATHVTFNLLTPFMTFPGGKAHESTAVQLHVKNVLYVHRRGFTTDALRQHPLAVKGDCFLVTVAEAATIAESVLMAVLGPEARFKHTIADVLRGGSTPATSVHPCRDGGKASGAVMVYLQTEAQAKALKSVPSIPIIYGEAGQVAEGLTIRVDSHDPTLFGSQSGKLPFTP